jgi:hypothetical protein
MTGNKIAHTLFLGAGKGNQCPGVQPRSGCHGAQAVKIGIYVGGDDVHKRPSRHDIVINARIIRYNVSRKLGDNHIVNDINVNKRHLSSTVVNTRTISFDMQLICEQTIWKSKHARVYPT